MIIFFATHNKLKNKFLCYKKRLIHILLKRKTKVN